MKMKTFCLAIFVALLCTMVPPVESEAELWCQEFGEDCTEVEESIPEDADPSRVMMSMVVECIQDSDGTDEDGKRCWREVLEKLGKG